MLYCTVLYYIVEYCVVLYCTVLYRKVSCCTVLYYTGVFTGGVSGVWRVEWSLVTEPEEGEENNMFLYRNGDKIPELSHYAVHVGTGGWSAVTGRNISIPITNC